MKYLGSYVRTILNVKASGYVHLKDQTQIFEDSIYQIHRQDGLTESWYVGITPQRIGKS